MSINKTVIYKIQAEIVVKYVVLFVLLTILVNYKIFSLFKLYLIK